VPSLGKVLRRTRERLRSPHQGHISISQACADHDGREWKGELIYKTTSEDATSHLTNDSLYLLLLLLCSFPAHTTYMYCCTLARLSIPFSLHFSQLPTDGRISREKRGGTRRRFAYSTSLLKSVELRDLKKKGRLEQRKGRSSREKPG
jgi:hypothetical protein